jgi:Bacterial shufflon protein, N-terminal constant region
MTNKHSRPRINRGVSLFSMAMVLGIVMIATPVGMERYANYLDEQNWTITATHLGTVNQGARQYIQDNYDTLLNQVKGGGNVTVTGQSLRDKGYLPAGFALTNSSAQNYVLTVTRNPTQTDKLVAFVLTAGGSELPFKAQRYIAQNTSGLGGYLYPANMANGASGGWQVNLASMGLSGQTGHLVTYLTSDALAGGAEESDRLYRFQVNGRPDLNKMHTAIDMGTNDLNNGNKINAKVGNFSEDINGKRITASDSITSSGWINSNGDIRSNTGWLITKQNKGWLNEDHGGGFYMDDNNWVKSVNGKGISTTGQLNGGTIFSNGRMTANEFLQLNKVATAGASCSPNGMVGRDSAGGILSCQSGAWKLAGSSSGKYISLGNYRGDFSGSNSGSGTMFLYVTGGNSGTVGGTCANTSRLQGYVSGQLISANADNSPSYGKVAFISFAVPPGTPYSISSYPTENKPCGPGLFTVYAYQM